MKRIICVCAVLMLILSVYTFAVSAASSEIIDKADIEMVVNTDGTVNVTEKWTVTYLNASDVFYRNIDIYSSGNGMTLLQKYDEIKDVAVRIDGSSVPPESAGINTFTWGKDADSLSYEIAVNCPSAQTTREYEISYTVTGAVKESGSDAVFSFMVIGDKFAYTSNNVSVSVVFPDDAENVTSSVTDNAEILNNYVMFTTKRVFDKFSVDVSSDSSVFEKDALTSYSVLAENARAFAGSLTDALPWILAVIVVVLVILLVLFPDRLVRLPSERSAKRLLKADRDVMTVNLPEEVSACQAYRMVMPVSRINPKASSKKVPVLFAMAVLECIEKGYIIADRNDLIVGSPKDDAPAYILSVLNFLKTFSDKKGNSYVIDKDFADRVRQECMTRYDVMANYLATFSELIPETAFGFFRKEANKEIYENVYLVKVNASKYKQKPTFGQNMSNVLAGKKTSGVEVFSMMFASSSPDKLFVHGGREGEKALCDALAAMYRVFVKSK